MRNKKRTRLFSPRSISNRRVTCRPRRDEWHQFDVKLNSRRGQRIRQCRRRAAFIKVTAIALTILTVSALVRWAYRQAFFENSEFRLTDLIVRTDGALSEADIATAAGIEMGMNLMTIDLKGVKRRLSALPMVIRSEIRRELPGRIEIAVEEHQPIAWLSCPAQGVHARNVARGYLVDQHGQVFRCEKMLKRFLDLPVIETPEMPALAGEGGQAGAAPVREAARLILENERLFAADGLQVTEVRVRNAFSLSCTYNTLMEVVFGLKDLERGLQDLRWIVTHAHSAGQQLATVNVMPAKNIPVTFYTPPSLRATPVPADGLPAARSSADRSLRPMVNGG